MSVTSKLKFYLPIILLKYEIKKQRNFLWRPSLSNCSSLPNNGPLSRNSSTANRLLSSVTCFFFIFIYIICIICVGRNRILISHEDKKHFKLPFISVVVNQSLFNNNNNFVFICLIGSRGMDYTRGTRQHPQVMYYTRVATTIDQLHYNLKTLRKITICRCCAYSILIAVFGFVSLF